jgi:hypothetical protein
VLNAPLVSTPNYHTDNKETVGKPPGSHGRTALPTVSNIKIADLLVFVNKYFPMVK